MRTLWLVTSLLALVGSVAWFISSPSWEPAVAVSAAVASLASMWATRTSPQGGIGGSAIVAGEGTSVNVANTGTIGGGSGGTGGDGGHAVRVGPGVTLNVINRGVISGGDAGTKGNEDA